MVAGKGSVCHAPRPPNNGVLRAAAWMGADACEQDFAFASMLSLMPGASAIATSVDSEAGAKAEQVVERTGDSKEEASRARDPLGFAADPVAIAAFFELKASKGIALLLCLAGVAAAAAC